MHIAILTFDGYNELDSIVALGILNRVKRPDWRVSLAAPSATVTSMNGVVLQTLRAQDWYNGDPPDGLRGFMDDRNNRLIGYAIVRQIRSKPVACR